MRYDVMAYYWSWEYIWCLQPVSISERCSYETTQWSWRTAQGRGWIRRWSNLTTAVLVSAPPPSPHPPPHPPQMRITLSVSVLTIPLDYQVTGHIFFSVSYIRMANYDHDIFMAILYRWLSSIYLQSHIHFWELHIFSLLLLSPGWGRMCHPIWWGSFIPRPRSPNTGPPQLLLPPTPHGGHYNLLLPGHHQFLLHHSVERELDHWRMWAGYDWRCHEVIISVLFHCWCSINHY